MRPVYPSQRQVYFSAALTAAAVALLSPSLHWRSPLPAAALDVAVTGPSRPAAPALPEAGAFASYRAAHRPAAAPSPPPSAARVSDDTESSAVIPRPVPPPAPRLSQAPQPPPTPAAYPSYGEVPSQSGAYSGGGSFQACVIAAESGGNSQVMNPSGHYGLYQFSASTWAEYGGNPADFGDASVAEQNQVFDNAIAAGGESNWAPYDHCL